MNRIEINREKLENNREILICTIPEGKNDDLGLQYLLTESKEESAGLKIIRELLGEHMDLIFSGMLNVWINTRFYDNENIKAIFTAKIVSMITNELKYEKDKNKIAEIMAYFIVANTEYYDMGKEEAQDIFEELFDSELNVEPINKGIFKD